jgi:hypothetical protein
VVVAKCTFYNTYNGSQQDTICNVTFTIKGQDQRPLHVIPMTYRIQCKDDHFLSTIGTLSPGRMRQPIGELERTMVATARNGTPRSTKSSVKRRVDRSKRRWHQQEQEPGTGKGGQVPYW